MWIALLIITISCFFIGFYRLIASKRSHAATTRISALSQRLSDPLKLDWMELGTVVTVWHPARGEVTACATGRIVYEELTQMKRGTQNSWVPTGNVFHGFRLETSLILLNWQNRFYLMDSRVEVTDDDIRRDFAPFARRFGQAEQKGDIVFEYPAGSSWHIEDIGKFRVHSVSGDWFPLRTGAVGRFIHAAGDGGRALIVEDFDGGGQDAVWTGYRIEENDIRKV